MSNLRNFLQSLRRSSGGKRASHEDSRQSADEKINSAFSFRNLQESREQKSNETWPPNEADYDQVWRLQDSERGYESELWWKI